MHAFERIERQGVLGWHEAAAAAGLEAYDWRLVEIGDALCSVSATEPSILINRVLGLGTEAAPTRETLAAIRRLYADAGISRFFLHIVPEISNPQTEALLTASGYRRYRGWMKFTRGPGAINAAATDLTIRRIGREAAADFAAIAAPAFDLTSASEPVIAALADDPHWHLYMSFADSRPAGTGAVYIRDELASLDWGATHPQFRRRGSQSAILSARLRDAFDAGCKTVGTMTGEAVPGDPQHSYSNILRAGFSEAYLRENWIPADA